MTEPTCSTPSCLTDRQIKEAVLTTKMNIIIFLSSIAVGLLGYSVYWQAPALRAEMAKEINRLDDADHDQRVETEKQKVRTDKLEDRVAALEKKDEP